MTDEIEKGFRFRSPAKETLERLAMGDKKFEHIQSSMTDLNLKFELMNQDLKEIKEDMKELKTALNSFCTSCDSRYASKQVEIWLNWGLKIIVGAVLMALLGLVVIKTI